MRPLMSAVVVFAWATALTGCAAGTPHPARLEPGDRAAITSVLGNQIDAWNRGDLRGYMDGYAHSPSLVFTSGGNVRRGWQDAFDHYQARYATDSKAMGALAFVIDSIDPVGADGAVVLGRWDLTGTQHPGRGVFTVVLERRAEGWRIIHDHTSVAADSPP